MSAGAPTSSLHYFPSPPIRASDTLLVNSLPNRSEVPPATLFATQPEVAEWFQAEVHPHDAAFRRSLRHQVPSPADTQVTYPLPRMNLTNLMLAWKRNRLTVQANLNHACDRIVPRAGTTRADIMPTDPRSVRLSVRWTI